MDEIVRIRAVLHQQRDRVPFAPIQQFHQELAGYDQIINNRGRGRIYRYQGPHPARAPAQGLGRGEPKYQRIKIEDDVLSYAGVSEGLPGVYIAGHSIDHYSNYFEIEILDVGETGQIGIGLVSDILSSLNSHPGVEANSVGYIAESGRFFINYGRGNSDTSQFGPVCGMGDRMGVGIRAIDDPAGGDRQHSKIFFTRNGQEVKSFDLALRSYQLYPTVSMQSEGEEVILRLDARWNPDDVTQMVVDCCEEDWVRLEDVRLNGMTLEYTGRGRSIHDVGLAQAKYPLDTTNHYFEFEIVDPGDKCYVAIGLAKQNYPMRRHPGWNSGSIAYHADDGKLFHGSGMGVHFGPKCSMGDTMGCGIYFPPDYDHEAEAQSNDEDEEEEEEICQEEEEGSDEDEEGVAGQLGQILRLDDSDDDDPFFRPPKKRHQKGKGAKVTEKMTWKNRLNCDDSNIVLPGQHSHCVRCRQVNCSQFVDNVTACVIVTCGLCGWRCHECKQGEHVLNCPEERVPCVNKEYGCPHVLKRGKMASHLPVCPASVVCCAEEWSRWPMHAKDKGMRLPLPATKAYLDCGQLDVSLAMRDQRMLIDALRAPHKLRRTLRNHLTQKYPAAPLTHRNSSFDSDAAASADTSQTVSDDETDAPWDLSKPHPGLKESIRSRLFKVTKETTDSAASSLRRSIPDCKYFADKMSRWGR
ncbi:SPRY domain-containing protein 3 [Bulinus truncatus]|nr:SPRY domain-containing protein 3 [Bulinus truncatus]